MKKLIKLGLALLTVATVGCSAGLSQPETQISIFHQPSPPVVAAARAQIGVVTAYDTGYYSGGYPPEGRGACTDVVEQALRKAGYDLKTKIDADMAQFPAAYPHDSDPNINFRRVRNVKIFLDRQATSLPEELNNWDQWQAGDIVTYDQIPGSLWHIAVVSDRKNADGRPLLIHNYGAGVVEDDMLADWPAPITGHYRIENL